MGAEKKQGAEMRGEMVVMKKPVVGCGAAMVREATSGGVVCVLPQVWAVGSGPALRALPERNTGVSSLREPMKPSRSGRHDGALLGGAQQEAQSLAESEVAFYRKYTEALLRRYQRMRLATGRVPSPMDQEVFRGKMSHYKVQGFDDAVIFCADVERCLERLNGADQGLVRRIAVQEYTMGEAAALLGMSLRSCIVLYRRALDRLTRLFLTARLLEPERSLSRG